MERLVKGDVVVIPFPFTDLSGSKKRPALVVADIQGEDLWLVQITSQTTKDKYAIPLSDADFAKGRFNRNSNIRPNKIFTLSSNIILYKVGTVNSSKLSEVKDVITDILEDRYHS